MNIDARQQDLLGRMGVNPEIGEIISVVEIYEDDPRFMAMQQIAAQWGVKGTVSTKFTEEEREQARSLTMAPQWENGYPQPEDDFGYRAATYDLTDACEPCGMGERQVRPFRLYKPPRWGRRSIFQFFWVTDEYFVEPTAWAEVFKPLGVACRPAVLHKTGAELDNVVQLWTEEVVDVDVSGLTNYEDCSRCGRRKYHYPTRGFEPKVLGEPKSHLFKSIQYFGSGGQAGHMVMVSNALWRRIREHKLRGATYHPCAPWG